MTSSDTGVEAMYRDQHDRGAVAVEFALLLPILLLFVFGIINFGIVFSQQLTLNNAVREGARGAVVNEDSTNRTCQGILDAVQNEAAAIGMNADQISVRVTQDGFPTTGVAAATAAANACPSGFSSTSLPDDRDPCKGSFNANTGASGSIVVEAKYPSGLIIAFPPFPTTIGLSAKAVYRCEFS